MPSFFDDRPEMPAFEWRLLEAMPHPVSYVDADLVFLWCNTEGATAVGSTPDEVIGRSACDVLDAESEAIDLLRRVLASGEPCTGTIEFAIPDPASTSFHRVSCVPDVDAEGRTIGVLAVSVDVTDLVRGGPLLHESEARLSAILDNMPVGMWIVDSAGRVTAKNKAADRIWAGDAPLSGRPEDYVEYVAWDAETGERLEADDYPLVRTLRTGLPVTPFELRIRRFDGTDGFVIMSTVPLRGLDGSVSGAVAVNVDITKRKQAEEALEQTRSTLAEAQEIAHVGSYEYVAATRTTLWSEEEYRIFGLDPAGPSPSYDVMLANCVHPDDAALLHDAFTKAMQTGSVLELEHRIVRPDGSVRWVYDRARPDFDDSGNLLRYVGATQDITERRLAEAALLQSREDLDRAQTVGQIGWWRLDTRENILTWSDENHRIFGLPIGTPLTYEIFLSVVHPDDREFVDTRWQAGLRSEPYDIEHRLLVEGQVKWVREKAYLEYDGAGELLGGFGITQDITELKLAEQALRESEAERAAQQERARLARDLHDSVTQALFAATLKAEALTEGGDPAQLESLAGAVCRLNRGALAQMRTLLLELRGDPLAAVPIRQLLQNAVEAAESRAGVKVTLTLSEASPLPPKVHEAVYRITQEALSNVVRHAQAQNAWVQLNLDPSYARLLIGDDGCGFDPGASVDPSHLGLKSMSERAVDSGGELTLRSVQDEGTVLTAQWRFEGSASPPGRDT